jgi:isoleucyl-tRNA synthetase
MLDRWLLSQLQVLIRDVDAAMDRFDTQEVGRRLAAFIDDLSNWYVRRSRRRFWRGEPSALATLHHVVAALTLLMAPITPFITERVWQDLVVPVTPDAPESVHLAGFPVPDDSLVDPTLSGHVALARRLVEVGRSARAAAGIRTRQPLSSAVVSGPDVDGLPAEVLAEVAAELNVGSVRPMPADSLVDTTAKANFRVLGGRFGARVQAVAAAIATTDAGALSDALRDTGAASVLVDGEGIALAPDEVIITRRPRQGWGFAQDAGATVALDLTITPELRRAGVAREAIRRIQDARKASGLAITDRIVLRYVATDPVTAEALREYADQIAEEVLATEFSGEGEQRASGPRGFHDAELGLTFRLRRVAVGGRRDG